MMTMKVVLGGGGVASEVAKSAIWEVGNPNLVVIDTTINSSATCLARKSVLVVGFDFFFSVFLEELCAALGKRGWPSK